MSNPQPENANKNATPAPAENSLSILHLLNQFNPNPDNLVRWLKPQLTPADLSWIADSDYSMGYERYLTALQSVYDTLTVPSPAYRQCAEVLFYISYRRPSDNHWTSNGRTERQEHLTRLFTCTLLNMVVEQPNGWYQVDNLIGLIESSLALGQEATNLALQLISWRSLTTLAQEAAVTNTSKPSALDRTHEMPFLALTVLLLVVSVQPTPKASQLNQLANWVFETEATARTNLTTTGGIERLIRHNEANKKDSRPNPEFILPDGFTQHWLLGLENMMQRSWREWQGLGQRLLLNPAVAHSPAAATSLQKIGRLLVGSDAIG